MQDLIKDIINLKLGKILVNEKMSNFTTYRIGGKVRAIVYPNNEENLVTLIKMIKERNIKYFVLGNGSNVLFSDELYDGIIIKLDSFNKCEVDGNIIKVDSGYSLVRLSNVAVKNGLAGLEFASGIPGTLGGAIFMNAGAYGEDMSKIVKSVRILTNDLEIKEFTNKEMEFSYRTSVLQNHLGCVIISAVLELTYGNQEELENIVKLRREQRINSQPLNFPSAGSVFRNPEGMYAGKMIEEMGLKGYTVGKAQVSPKHGNFIVNLGNAKANDVKRIIDYIKKKALTKYGVKLRVEQRLINWAGVNIYEGEEETKN